MSKMSLNTLKMLVLFLDGKKVIPETFSLDYFNLANIKSRFAVLTADSKSLIEFSNLHSAYKFIELLAGKMSFSTQEFFDNFRIVEFKYVNGHCKIMSIIVNLVDFFSILTRIKDGEISKDFFIQDIDFKNYYNEYASEID